MHARARTRNHARAAACNRVHVLRAGLARATANCGPWASTKLVLATQIAARDLGVAVHHRTLCSEASRSYPPAPSTPTR